MISDRKVIVVMPAYNAAKTLEQTLDEIPRDISLSLEKVYNLLPFQFGHKSGH